MHDDEIIELFPSCKIMNIIRDPRDVAVSIIAAKKSWNAYWASNSINKSINLWKEMVYSV